MMMKKLALILLAFAGIAVSSCHAHGPHVVIATQNNNSYTKLEYAGNVVLNGSHTQIQSINYGGYVNFNRNNDELYIATDKDGKLFYELNGDKQTDLNGTGKNLLAQAVQIIARSQKAH